MGIVNGIVDTANLLGSAVAIHSSIKYFSNQAPKSNDYPHTYPVITLEAEKTAARLYEHVLFRGTTTIPGIVYIYSADVKEAQTYPMKGKFFVTLYFTKPGVYEIYAKIYNHESNSIFITIE